MADPSQGLYHPDPPSNNEPPCLPRRYSYPCKCALMIITLVLLIAGCILALMFGTPHSLLTSHGADVAKNSTAMTTGDGNADPASYVGHLSSTVNTTVFAGMSRSAVKMMMKDKNRNRNGGEDESPSKGENVVEYAKLSNETMQELQRFNLTEVKITQGQKFGIRVLPDIEKWREAFPEGATFGEHMYLALEPRATDSYNPYIIADYPSLSPDPVYDWFFYNSSIHWRVDNQTDLSALNATMNQKTWTLSTIGAGKDVNQSSSGAHRLRRGGVVQLMNEFHKDELYRWGFVDEKFQIMQDTNSTLWLLNPYPASPPDTILGLDWSICTLGILKRIARDQWGPFLRTEATGYSLDICASVRLQLLPIAV